jgi:signal transduction histidine kinase
MPRHDRPRVWLVDDSPMEAAIASGMLAKRFAVEVFSRASVLLERLAQGPPPAVVVLDWNMPEISGLDVCKFVRKTFDASRLPILVFTATREEDELVAGLSAGANDFVSKPCSAAELNARVAALVERKGLWDQHQLDSALRERFIGILGHDLRQPLNTFVIGTRVLLEAGLPERETKTVARLAAAADRMHRMILDMLDLTRSRIGGGIPIERERVDLGELCRLVVEEMRVGHPSALIALESFGDTTGMFDPDRATQIVTNLVANALEHGNGTEPIYVQVHGGDDAILLSVENKGQPIAPELLGALFDPFRRGRETNSTGLGLGLFIVHELVVGHDGSIRVESNERSTRFEIHFSRRGGNRSTPPPR